MINHFKYIFKKLYCDFLNLIYNRKCLICGCAKDDVLLCKTCAKDIEFLSGFAHKIIDEVPVYSATIYDGNIKKLIHKLKFQHRKTASIVLSKILFDYFKKLDLNDDYIIAYPQGYYLRNFQRGYNHLYLIVKEFSRLSNIEVSDDLILKIKYTKPQYKAKNKVKNITGSYKINEKALYKYKIKNKTVLLIDDITTTGATLAELIKILKEKDVKNIVCLTIAKSKF